MKQSPIFKCGDIIQVVSGRRVGHQARIVKNGLLGSSSNFKDPKGDTMANDPYHRKQYSLDFPEYGAEAWFYEGNMKLIAASPEFNQLTPTANKGE